jgi:hypothetical protein
MNIVFPPVLNSLAKGMAIVGALNGMITFLLFGPVRKLFFVQEDDE